MMTRVLFMVVPLCAIGCATGSSVTDEPTDPDNDSGLPADRPDGGAVGADASALADGGIAPADAATTASFPDGMSRWEGEYECAQGLSSLALELMNDAGDLSGTFQFSEHPANPGTESGSYSLAGLYDGPTRTVELTPVAWIDEPPGDWTMVGLTGELNSMASQITGTVELAGCATFDVREM